MLVDSLKALDPNRPIREADIERAVRYERVMGASRLALPQLGNSDGRQVGLASKLRDDHRQAAVSAQTGEAFISNAAIGKDTHMLKFTLTHGLPSLECPQPCDGNRRPNISSRSSNSHHLLRSTRSELARRLSPQNPR